MGGSVGWHEPPISKSYAPDAYKRRNVIEAFFGPKAGLHKIRRSHNISPSACYFSPRWGVKKMREFSFLSYFLFLFLRTAQHKLNHDHLKDATFMTTRPCETKKNRK